MRRRAIHDAWGDGTRRLGRSGLKVRALGFGCWAIGGPFRDGATHLGWGAIDDIESIRAVHCALDLGVNLFDTADLYGAGHSEDMLGRALMKRRHNVVIATKFGYTFDEATKEKTGADASPDYIRRACDASLKRLRTDYIDIFQFHQALAQPHRVREVRDVLESLVNSGKIRWYGWSTLTPSRARVFAEGRRCTAIQHPLNALRDDQAMLEACESLDMASVNRAPLAMGLLTGKFTSASRMAKDDVRGAAGLSYLDWFSEGRPRSTCLQQFEAIREVLRSGGRTPAQGALAWIWARSDITIPIPGARTEAQVRENCTALEFGPLRPDEMDAINVILQR